MAGSYYVECLTDELERMTMQEMERIEAMGGAIAAVEKGYFQHEIHEVSYRYQRQVELRERTVVGVNRFKDTVQSTLGVGDNQVFQVDQDAVRREQSERLVQLRQARDSASVQGALEALGKAAEDPRENLMPPIVESVKRYATLGEICDVLRRVWGEYKEVPFAV